MEPADRSYTAIRPLNYNGVRAYNTGDTVHADAVEGPDSWLVLGEDVIAREGAHLDRPAKSASQAAWAAYATSQGMDSDEAQGSSRKDLIGQYGEEEDRVRPSVPRKAAAAGSDG